MFTKFEAVALPEHFQLPGKTKFSVCVNVNGKKYYSETSVSTEALVYEGFVDHFFRQFISAFKEELSVQLNTKKETGVKHERLSFKS